MFNSPCLRSSYSLFGLSNRLLYPTTEVNNNTPLHLSTPPLPNNTSTPLPPTAQSIKSALSPIIHSSGPNGVGQKFAVIICQNLQYKVSPGDTIAVQRLAAEIGSCIALKKVLMVGGPRFTSIGRPLLSNCRVLADVEEHKRMKSALYVKHHKGRHRTTFKDTRHAATILRITSVEYDPSIVGELDKDDGILIPGDDKRVQDLISGNGAKLASGDHPIIPPIPCYWVNDLQKDGGLI